MEIGSEFWKYEDNLISNNTDFWNLGEDTKFVLSGRTAIYFVLQNILLNHDIKKAYLPTYCCNSMIKPFIDLGIEIEYYDVYYNNGLKYNINLDEDFDIFFAMNYFGYSSTNMEKYIKTFKEKGKIIIEDITHSFFSSKKFSIYSDYLVGSLRKWFPVTSGGIAVNRKTKFELKLNDNTNEKIISLRKKAMENKSKFINNNENLKETFLNQYSKSGKLLENDYKNYSIDNDSLKIIMGINLEKIISRRKENSNIIYEKLKNISSIEFLEKYNENDCLLFVPIILEHNLRNELRKYLIENEVYLPVHWPLEEKLNNVFEKELSLVCDQRYTKEQISKYVDMIINFFEK